VPPAQSRRLHELIPGSRHETIEGGVHGLVFEGVERLTALLDAWLAEHD
jgi:pimeloyl-ACP methyl ester carboxylesterase